MVAPHDGLFGPAGTGAESGEMERMDAEFGFKRIALEEKQGLVDDVFHKVARRYDIMNDLMSGGLHRLWKDAMVSWLSPPRKGRPGSFQALDVAGGTGDIAFRIVERSDRVAQATVLDINGDMLAVGRERAVKRKLDDAVTFVEANAESLPLPDNHFDSYTIAFGLRNVPRREVAIAEAFRVLKPGGRYMCLEFSHVDMPVLDKVYDFYSFNVIPKLGQAVAGDGEPYRYLVESIRTFPNPERFAAMLGRAGFERVSYRLLSGGIAAIHSGYKL
ncbi:demethylmenaquinone methyltransferase / 2-methoxy-6-polyprenyl-1,4-benzoquinol methylase [Pseudoxanthobacter soli DSM 19599]|uniref:Ubiquinone/menaquinone biosynthesis C-methyltransferase UbiE n=2 Tax=Pseudoxanthobacter TaxID=433838 RepID=A0A1M7ZJT3_9HYPH|nr:demethylmenaquinone methyltransferase / 2-methoxy-6-polyprenyl-1,4-benzoquinol methylase [Pseudoxanthobacter soli DSM 19599]